MKKLFPLILFFLGGCAGQTWYKINPQLSELSVNQIAQMVEVENSPNLDFKKYKAPLLSNNFHFKAIRYNGFECTIRGEKSNNNKNSKAHDVFVRIDYYDKSARHYNYVTDAVGNVLSITRSKESPEQCNSKKCYFNEMIQISVLDYDLRSFSGETLKMIFISPNGDKKTVAIPKKYIFGYLRKFDQ